MDIVSIYLPDNFVMNISDGVDSDTVAVNIPSQTIDGGTVNNNENKLHKLHKLYTITFYSCDDSNKHTYMLKLAKKEKLFKFNNIACDE